MPYGDISILSSTQHEEKQIIIICHFVNVHSTHVDNIFCCRSLSPSLLLFDTFFTRAIVRSFFIFSFACVSLRFQLQYFISTFRPVHPLPIQTTFSVIKSELMSYCETYMRSTKTKKKKRSSMLTTNRKGKTKKNRNFFVRVRKVLHLSKNKCE